MTMRVFLALGLATTAALAGCSGAKPEVGGMILSKGRVASERQATTPFVPGEGVHAFVTLKDDPGGSKLRGRVTAVLVEGLKKGEVVDAMARTTAKDDGPTYDLAYDEAPLAPGTYEFAVWLNAATDAPPAQAIKFKVVAPGTDPSEAAASPEPVEEPDPAATATAPPIDTGEPVVSMGPFKEIFLTRADDENTDMATRRFQDPTRQLWCHAILKQAKPGQVVIIRFVAEQVVGARREQVLHESRVVLQKGIDYAQFPLKGQGGGALPKGQWRADLQRRESVDAEASIRFVIE